MPQPQLYRKADPLVTRQDGYKIEFLTLPVQYALGMRGCEIQEDGLWVKVENADTSKHTGVFANVRKTYSDEFWK